LLAVALLAVMGYYIGRRRAVVAAVAAGPRAFHSLPGYHGGYVAFWAVIPAIAAFLIWQIAEPFVLREAVLGSLPESYRAMPAEQLGLDYNDIRNIAAGNFFTGDPDEAILAAADRYNSLRRTSRYLATGFVGILVLFGIGWALKRVQPDFRARNRVERNIEYLLIGASSVAILTTIGIFASVLFEALRFFQSVSPLEFLFGLEWSPQISIREDRLGRGLVRLDAGEALIDGGDGVLGQHQLMAAQHVIDVEAGVRQHVEIGNVARGERQVFINFRAGDDQHIVETQLGQLSLEVGGLGRL
jgi:phosphate transport system permease protein